MTRSSQPIDLSFEVFPADSDVGQAVVDRTIRELSPLSPRFVSVTYGANGTGQSRTPILVRKIAEEGATVVAGHLTCMAGSKADTLAIAKDYESAGARWAVALRGDPAEGAGHAFSPLHNGYRDAPELIAAIRENTDLRIAIGGYPEPHPDSRGDTSDFDHLKRKVDAGADAIVTQFFFDNDDFYRYVEKCRAAGIDIPIVPGVMPIANFSRIARFSAKCGAKIPARIAERFEKAEERGAARELAMAVCAGQCDELRDQGVRAFHFYTLNRSDLTLAVCQALGLDPRNPVDGHPALEDADEMRLAASA